MGGAGFAGGRAPANNVRIAASQYSFAELADIYNQTRVDYIVPMPMNARRMAEYVAHYSVDLDASSVAVDEHGGVLGIAMLGIRGQRAWLTRLGVIPHRRRRHVGQSLVLWLLEAARERHITRAQLEVIDGNEPALRLFQGFGFAPRRTLLVIRRPPEPATLPACDVQPLTADAIAQVLTAHTRAGASWIDEATSMENAGGLHGLSVTLEDGRTGAVAFRVTPVQITHLALGVAQADQHDNALIRALLSCVHAHFPDHDTKIENLPLSSPAWPAFQQMAYGESFRRIEMALTL